MKIGMVCPYSFDEPGGVQAHILDLAQHFIDAGHEVRVLGPCSPTTEVPDFVVRGGRSFPVPYNGSVARIAFGPGVVRRVTKFLIEGEFDVLHVHEPNSPSFSMIALWVADGPIVATYHTSSRRSRALKLVGVLLRPWLERIRGGIAVSEMARRWQVEQLGGDSVLIPNGVDTERFAAARKPPQPTPEIVFLGRLDEPRKGLDVLLDALTRVQGEFTCTVIGGGTPRTQPHVRYVGKVSDAEKAEILGRADIYVAPNVGGESFGIVLVEAMAAGCAVVASDLEAFTAVAADAASFFPVGDAAALARQLSALLADPEARRQLAERGVLRSQRFDWDTVANDVMRVYETVAGGKVRVCSRFGSY
ncbi:glycosyltransferase family 4 protein [Corynebacterium sp.]|uniref:glycosyltransferase family 4 protein n=1 Tax=Corynebacterium sp. TaxID=1720 RepID=UPI0026DC40AE|nr:glycosyltransferase family 4 protein [Corynebacterium sp.]MDO5077989.1 glycosyltransferase family 4 protein [Corynebacterium sp.]